MAPSSLSLSEAVPLLHAWVAELGRRCDIRLLLIKGPVLAMHGLRDERLSSDVDVLIEPADFDRFTAELFRLGWQDHTPYDMAWLVPRHSMTFRHPIWPCELDVHSYFPGFLAPPGHVFDVLWARRVAASMAGQDVDVPDVVGNAVIAALHSLRDGKEPQKAMEFRQLSAHLQGWSNDDKAAVAELARATGAAQTARPLLTALGLSVCDLHPPDEASLEAWLVQSSAQHAPGSFWLALLRRTPWPNKPGVLWRALVLPESEMRRLVPGLPPGRAALWRARVRRILRGSWVLASAARRSRRERAGT